MKNKYSKSDYGKIELSNLELEIIIQSLSNPNFRLLFNKEMINDTLGVCKDHQKKILV